MNNSDRDKCKQSYIKRKIITEPCRTTVSVSEREEAQKDKSEMEIRSFTDSLEGEQEND